MNYKPLINSDKTVYAIYLKDMGFDIIPAKIIIPSGNSYMYSHPECRSHEYWLKYGLGQLINYKMVDKQVLLEIG
jgi:hypothetical protein